MTVAGFLWNIVLAVMETVLMYYLLNERLGDGRNRLRSAVGAIAVLVVLLPVNLLPVSSVLRICLIFGLGICYAYFGFDGGRTTRILWGCIPGLTALTAETLATETAWIFQYGTIGGQQMDWGWFYNSVICIMIQIILVLIAGNFGGRREYSLTCHHLFLLVAVSVISVFAIHLQMQIAGTLAAFPGTQSKQRSAIFVSLCFLIILLALIFLVFSLGRESQKTLEKTLEGQQARLENEYYRSNEISVNALHELRHDISTHMHVLRSLLDEGRTLELKEYFDSMEAEYKKADGMFMTGNTLLNAMLTNKQMVAEKDGIEIRLSYTTKRVIPLAPMDFCSLVGNLLDNALEACRRVIPEGDRYIDVAVGDKGEMVYIKVKNCTDGYYNVINGFLHTTKQGAGHGVGLKRVRGIAESAGGFFDYIPRGREFTAVVMLPAQQAEENGNKTAASADCKREGRKNV